MIKCRQGPHDVCEVLQRKILGGQHKCQRAPAAILYVLVIQAAMPSFKEAGLGHGSSGPNETMKYTSTCFEVCLSKPERTPQNKIKSFKSTRTQTTITRATRARVSQSPYLNDGNGLLGDSIQQGRLEVAQL